MEITPIVWKVGDLAKKYPRVTVELTRSEEGVILYAVRSDGDCLSRGGRWRYEPFPSNRTAEFFKHYRFPTFEEACEAAVKACAKLEKQRD